LSSKPWIRIFIGLKYSNRIRIESNADPQNCHTVSRIPVSKNTNSKKKNELLENCLRISVHHKGPPGSKRSLYRSFSRIEKNLIISSFLSDYSGHPESKKEIRLIHPDHIANPDPHSKYELTTQFHQDPKHCLLLSYGRKESD
jgi:hypothetical protein